MDKPTKVKKQSSTASHKGNSSAGVKKPAGKKPQKNNDRAKKPVGETLNLASGMPADTENPKNYGATKVVAIYGLVDPITQELRYIGKSTDIASRYQQHLKDNGRSHKANWIKALLARSLTPDLFILEQCAADQWQEAERFWIAYFRSIGANLTNTMAGGNEPYCPKEVRARNGKANAASAAKRDRNLWALRRLIGAAKKDYAHNPRILELANRTSRVVDTADGATLARLSKWFGLTQSNSRTEAKRIIMEQCHG